ncbi:conserved hypothetical protein [Latilactobacillus sakei]|nr:hypothetical protein LS25_1483 [Latilactobacillus sakei subsp. sakei LS25]SOB39145.1 conserved hypothetical protein [Latilactobacillus sakei]
MIILATNHHYQSLALLFWLIGFTSIIIALILALLIQRQSK